MFRGSNTYSPGMMSRAAIQQETRICRFFFAFILLGVGLFWKSAMFANPESAAEVLFSLMYLGSV